jgi:hypothetical protein
MTETEWLTSVETHILVAFLGCKASDRKMRLFACGVCRQLASYVETEEYIRAIEAGEEFADTGKTKAAMRRGRQVLRSRRLSLLEMTSGMSDELIAIYLAEASLSENKIRYFINRLSALYLMHENSGYIHHRAVTASGIVREVFGNPFRSVSIDPSWLTSTVLTLAQGIYADRIFDRLPALADALQDAGCKNEDILNHCRQPGVHVWGCWAVDLLLGKV